jgi:hypothetical protein
VLARALLDALFGWRPGRESDEDERSFVILIVLKTAVDVVIHLAVDLREQAAPAGPARAARLT